MSLLCSVKLSTRPVGSVQGSWRRSIAARSEKRAPALAAGFPHGVTPQPQKGAQKNSTLNSKP